MSRDAMKQALRGLRRKSMAASRTGGGDRALLISIGMAEPEEESHAEEHDEDEDDEAKAKRARR